MKVQTQVDKNEQADDLLIKEFDLIYQLQKSFRSGDFDTFNRLHEVLLELRKKIYESQINFPDPQNSSDYETS